MIDYGSVCSGIEAASVAWEPLGWVPAWFGEIEPFPSAVLAHHWPQVTNLGDMTKIADMIRLGLIHAPAALVAGTPCQAFSVAGNRESLLDERGQLTLAFINLADTVDEIRLESGYDESIIVWENVPGVLNTRDNAFGCFLAGLAGEEQPLQPPGSKWSNAGFVSGPKRAVAWRVLDAQYFGVAQRRRRVFVVASARDGFDPCAVLFESEGMRRDTSPSREAGQEAADDAGTGIAIPILEPGSRTGKSTTDRRAGIGVGQDGDPMFTLQAGKQHGIGVIPPEGCWWDGGQVSQTLDAVLHKGQTMPEKNRFPAVLQPVGSTGDVAHPPAIACVHGTQDPIVSNYHAHALGRNGGQENAVFTPAMAIRRLTPVECERLQGFPDGHTDIPYRGKPAPISQRYKAIGNSMAVPCMRFIAERINQQLER